MFQKFNNNLVRHFSAALESLYYRFYKKEDQNGPWYYQHKMDLETYALNNWNKSLGPAHGPEHWRRVENFGLLLWDPKKVDSDVVLAFAYLHDLKRHNNDEDPGHGERAAELVDKLRDSLLSYLSKRQIRLLKRACLLHSNTTCTLNATINTCFDSDRLDLPRCGIVVNPKQLATERARMLCETEWYKTLWSRYNEED